MDGAARYTGLRHRIQIFNHVRIHFGLAAQMPATGDAISLGAAHDANAIADKILNCIFSLL